MALTHAEPMPILQGQRHEAELQQAGQLQGAHPPTFPRPEQLPREDRVRPGGRGVLPRHHGDGQAATTAATTTAPTATAADSDGVSEEEARCDEYRESRKYGYL